MEALKVGSGSGSSCNQDPDLHQCDADPQHCSKPSGARESRLLCVSCSEFKPVIAGYPVSSEQYPHWPYLLLNEPLIYKNVRVLSLLSLRRQCNQISEGCLEKFKKIISPSNSNRSLFICFFHFYRGCTSYMYLQYDSSYEDPQIVKNRQILDYGRTLL
jgi:hypothetical protein